jgi:hypothetical protein
VARGAPVEGAATTSHSQVARVKVAEGAWAAKNAVVEGASVTKKAALEREPT